MKFLIKSLFRAFGYQAVPLGAVVRDARQMRRLLCFRDMLELIKNIEGDIVECGVGKGQSMVNLVFLAAEEGRGRQVIGIDSFEGFPEPTTEDSSVRQPKKGEWAGTSPEDVFRMLRVAGLRKFIDENKVQLRKGYFGAVIKEWDKQNAGPIAFLHIDGDLYESYVDALTLVGRVPAGGVVLFDEYGESSWPGATKAVDEFLAQYPYRLQKHSSGKFYFVKR